MCFGDDLLLPTGQANCFAGEKFHGASSRVIGVERRGRFGRTARFLASDFLNSDTKQNSCLQWTFSRSRVVSVEIVFHRKRSPRAGSVPARLRASQEYKLENFTEILFKYILHYAVYVQKANALNVPEFCSAISLPVAPPVPKCGRKKMRLNWSFLQQFYDDVMLW